MVLIYKSFIRYIILLLIREEKISVSHFYYEPKNSIVIFTTNVSFKDTVNTTTILNMYILIYYRLYS